MLPLPLPRRTDLESTALLFPPRKKKKTKKKFVCPWTIRRWNKKSACEISRGSAYVCVCVCVCVPIRGLFKRRFVYMLS